MVTLRTTLKVRRYLSESPAHDDLPDTALGDWYVNRIVIGRRPLLILVSSTSLLAMLTPARNVKTLPSRLAALVAERLRRLDADDAWIRAELSAMATVRVGRTTDRSVVGSMVDFAHLAAAYLPRGCGGDDALKVVEDKLAATPCRCGKRAVEVIFPRDAAPARLRERWAGTPGHHPLPLASHEGTPSDG